MKSPPGIILLFHGLMVFSVGVLSGIPYWLSIIRNKGSETIRSWRVAHSFLGVYGMWILIAGLIAPYLSLNDFIFIVLKWALVTSGYAFVVAFVLGAWMGYRGLTPKPYGLNTVFFIGHFIGIGGSLIAIAIIIYGLLNALD